MIVLLDHHSAILTVLDGEVCEVRSRGPTGRNVAYVDSMVAAGHR